MPTEESADELQAFLAQLSTSDGLFCVDSSQRVIHWSATAQQVLGYAPEDVVGRPCYEVIGGRDSRNYRFCRRSCPIMANARRGRPTQDYDALTRKADGTDVWVNASIVLLKGRRNRRPLVLHLIRDVTERRRIEELARRTMSTLRQLVAEPEAAASQAPAEDPRPTPVPALSRRELQVLRLLACGLGTHQIAEEIGVSPVTARNHITSLVTKLGAQNRLQAVLYASQCQLI